MLWRTAAIALLSLHAISAQQPSLPAWGVAADAQGNAYYVANVTVKLDPSGNVLWSKPPGGTAIALDPNGNVYVTGLAGGDNSIVAGGGGLAECPFPTNLGGYNVGNLYVSKLDSAGNLIFTACLQVNGGIGFSPEAIAVDAAGSAYVTGLATSSSFPTTSGTLQPAMEGDSNSFLLKLDPTGGKIDYLTYFGGQGTNAYTIAVDSQGRAYLGGFTTNLALATPGAAQPTISGSTLYRSSDQGAHWSRRGDKPSGVWSRRPCFSSVNSFRVR